MDAIYLSPSQRDTMLAHTLRMLPEEACGLLGGSGERVSAVLPVTNQLHSRSRYFMEPVELLQALNWLDDHGLDILAIYHSHPRGPGAPSPSDITEFNYPGCATLIWFPDQSGWSLRGFMIEDQNSREIQVVIDSGA